MLAERGKIADALLSGMRQTQPALSSAIFAIGMRSSLSLRLGCQAAETLEKNMLRRCSQYLLKGRAEHLHWHKLYQFLSCEILRPVLFIQLFNPVLEAQLEFRVKGSSKGCGKFITQHLCVAKIDIPFQNLHDRHNWGKHHSCSWVLQGINEWQSFKYL